MRVESYVAQRADYASFQEFEKAKNDQRTIEELLKKYDLHNPVEIKRLHMQVQSGKILFMSSLGDRFAEELSELYEGKSTVYSETEKFGVSRQASHKSEKQYKSEPITEKKERFEDLDRSMQKSVLKELKKSQRRRRLVIGFLAVLAVGCIGYFFWYYKSASSSESRWEELASLVGSDALLSKDNETEEPLVIHYDDQEIVVPPVLQKYQTLYNKNKSLIGWIKIADTIIDYPVMQCGDNEYYLKHNFDQKEDQVGCIFLDCDCDVLRGCDNYILYGHHLQSGKMFSGLGKYEDIKYYEKHPYVVFDTIYEEHTYQIMYVFRSRVYEQSDVNFKYYQFINANSAEEFASAMQEMAAMSYYDTGVKAVYGDQLLTLSTCDYEQLNGRFVVVCKQIE